MAAYVNSYSRENDKWIQLSSLLQEIYCYLDYRNRKPITLFEMRLQSSTLLLGNTVWGILCYTMYKNQTTGK